MECVECEKFKHSNYFSKKTPDRCKKCVTKKRVKDNPNDEKTCTSCHIRKTTSEFYVSELGLGSWCKVCTIENSKSRRIKSKNQEKITMEKLLEKISKLEIEVSDLKSSSNDDRVSCF